MKLTKGEQQHIKSLLTSPQWQVAEGIANQFRDKIAYESVLRDTQWETIKTALLQEGRVQGIKMFTDELYRIASEYVE